MNPIVLSTSGPYRRYCHCWGCHPRRGWRRRVRLGLLVLGLFLASFLFVSGCSESTAGLPGEPDSQPTADAGADTRAGDLPEQRKVMVDAQQVADAMPGPEVGADTTPGPEAGLPEAGSEAPTADASPEAPPCMPTSSSGCTADGRPCSPMTTGCFWLCPSKCATGVCCEWDPYQCVKCP